MVVATKYTLVCYECYSRNYKIKLNDSNKKQFNKFCPSCNKYTIHKISL
ncbi:MAG: 50S ribosomal protein L33 [Mycoplasmataceae bacterium]|nr:50S ribosomal protein L33 [Mycoplasmataceae bacterium]